jgi:hypothetical protein
MASFASESIYSSESDAGEEENKADEVLYVYNLFGTC